MSVCQLGSAVWLTGAKVGAPNGGLDCLAKLCQDQVAQLEPEGHCLGVQLPLSPELGLEEQPH